MTQAGGLILSRQVQGARVGLFDAQNSRYRGITVPFSRQAKGYFESRGTRDVIWSSILNILTTPIGSRIWQLDFGSELTHLVFEPNDELLEVLAFQYTAEALQKWEPRIQVINTKVFRRSDEDDALFIELSYRVIDDQTVETRSLIVSRSSQLGQGTSS